jgi:hypothetical protein
MIICGKWLGILNLKSRSDVSRIGADPAESALAFRVRRGCGPD